MTIGDFVRVRYLEQGLTLTLAVARIHIETGVSVRSAWAALRGTRVSPETAKRLHDWAWTEFGEELDVESMMAAPPRPRKREEEHHGEARRG